MTTVEIIRDDAGYIRAFGASGHAMFASRGTDIVCAAISAIVQTAALGLMRVVGVEISVERGDGRLHVVIPDGLTMEQKHDIMLIVETMKVGATDIAGSFPKQVKVVEVGQ